jgi:hypothetical protein
MKRKLAPHTVPIARNCTHVDSRPERRGPDAATAVFALVLVLTGRAYAPAPTAIGPGKVVVRNPPEVGRDAAPRHPSPPCPAPGEPA